MSYKPYPRSLYLAGDVLQERIVVQDEIDEVAMRHKGYLMAYEKPVESIVVSDAAMAMVQAAKDAEPAEKPAKKKRG